MRMPGRLGRAEQVQRNRELLLVASRRVFLQRGYARCSLEQVAEEAGFSKGVVYSQFGSKADLLFALLDRRIDERAAENERATRGLAGAEGVRALLRVAGRDAVVEQGWARLLVEFRALAVHDPPVNRRYAEMHDRALRALADLLGELHERAGVEPRGSTRSMAELMLALGAGITLERAANPDSLPAEDLLAIVPRALGLPDAGTSGPSLPSFAADAI
jgi:AcrR family transcriptional regulator